MRKWMVLGGVSLFVVAVVAYFLLTQFKVVNAWDGEGEAVVMANKVWSIHFSEKVAKDSVHSDSIYVLDDQGKKIKTGLSLSDDQKTVYIDPPKDGYKLDAKFYTLHFEKGIESSAGRNLGSDKSWKFVVKEELPVIGSKEKLNGYFQELLKAEKASGGWFSIGVEDSATESASDKKSSSENVGNAEYSQTNNQVQGVDEADIVKTDGKHIFQAEENEVRIIRAVPENDMQVLSRLSFNRNFMPHQLFLHEQKLVVIGYQFHDISRPYEQIAEDSKIAPMMQSTKAVIYDVKDPAKPVQIREVELEGGYVSARKVEGMVYLVSSHHPDYWLLREIDDLDIRPKYSDSASSPAEKTVGYDEISYFPDSKEPNYTLIAAIDLEQPKKKAAISTYLGSGEQMYMSKENIYLAVADWPERHPRGDWTEMAAPDTNIHKFSVKGMKVEFQGSALVQGTVLNQFSMDEHDGHFRVVTTKGYAWDESRPSSNALYILDENLKPTGKLESLARGERIYSARFMGDRIYMVTFKETDPLFVIEASNPAKPKVLGELKIPGFSNYLHPYDENHLIGFGHDTKIIAEKGAGAQPRILTDGVKISLFDVSDMNNPKEKFTEIIGGRGTYSPLNEDHKALLFNKEKNLFAFPISVYQNNKKSEYDQIFEYQGAYVYSIDPESGFTLKSKITHSDREQQGFYEDYEEGIKRLLYIGDTLYAISPGKVSSQDLKSYQKISELNLR